MGFRVNPYAWIHHNAKRGSYTMPQNPDSIVALLVQYPGGLKAARIATLCHEDRSTVNRILYSNPDYFIRDDNYVWKTRLRGRPENPRTQEEPSIKVEENNSVNNAGKMVEQESGMVCPTCGSPMLLKTARKGPYVGQNFWGCSAYPSCRTIIDIDNGNSQVTPTHDINSRIQFYATPLGGMDEMQSYQSIAISEMMLSRLRNRLLDEEELLSAAKFRIDYAKPNYRLNNEQRTLCALTLRLLLRGSVTMNSEKVEKAVASIFVTDNNPSGREYSDCFNDSDEKLPVPVDSNLELRFIEDCLKPLFGRSWARHVSTQVHIGSLITREIDNSMRDTSQRADFLISYQGKDIVIEINGQEHDLHKDKDEERENVLKRNGFQVITIKNEELNNRIDSVMQQLRQELGVSYNNTPTDTRHREVLALKLVHQIQIAIVSALYKGVFPVNARIKVQYSSDLFSKNELEQLLEIAIDDIRDVFDNYSVLYGLRPFFDCQSSPTGDFTISIGCIDTKARANVAITDISVGRAVENIVPPMDQLDIDYIDTDILAFFLRYIFRHPDFNEGQEEGIRRILNRKDSIVLLPTGSGKSLIYQLSSLLIPGKIVVVSPLTSLMQDQIDNLYYQGITCASSIYHGNTSGDSEASLSDPRISMTYISPERLQVKSFRDTINNLLINNSVFAVAVDEAHCVSEWGHDFRTAYLNIGRTSREVFQKDGIIPVIVALTGTASTAVLKDVQRELNIHDYDAIITPETFDRKELKFRVFKSSSQAKIQQLNSIVNDYIPQQFQRNQAGFYELKNDETNAGIVFCPHVNGDFGVQTVCGELKTMASTAYYSGGAPRYYTGNWDSEKRRVSSAFKSNRKNLLVATKAFGMGIDKPNVRFTVHYGVPGSIESFYQEAGRAGRDGNESQCVIIFSDDNHILNEKLLDPKTPLEEVAKEIDELNIQDKDDISRALYFHVNSFKGIKYESARISEVTKHLFKDGELISHTIIIKCGTDKDDNSLINVQKALQRLLVLGVLADYTVDYSAREIYVKSGKSDETSIAMNYGNYVRGYNEGRVVVELGKLYAAIAAVPKDSMDYKAKCTVAAAEVLIAFIYDTVEKGRRRGLREMVKVAEAALLSKDQDYEIRLRVIRYFESTYSIEINSVIESSDLGFDRIPIILDGEENEVGERVGGIRSANEAMGLRGQVSRYLESTPDHPGLLALRAISELFCKDYDAESVEVDFLAFIEFALERYSCSKERLIDFLIYFIKKSFGRDAEISMRLFQKATTIIDPEILCALFLESKDLTDEQKTIPASIFFNKKVIHLLDIIKNLKGEQ